jgi:hypothetical protein
MIDFDQYKCYNSPTPCNFLMEYTHLSFFFLLKLSETGNFSLDSKCWDVVTHHQRKLSACCREPQPHQLVAWSSPIGSLHSSHWGWWWHNTVPIHKTLTLAQLLQTLQKFQNTFQRDPTKLFATDGQNKLFAADGNLWKKRIYAKCNKEKKAEMCPNITNPI